MVFWISAFILRIYAKLYHRGRGFDKKNFPSNGPFIAAFNHSSNMDTVAMSLVINFRANAMGKDTLFKVPILGWWLKKVGAFPVVRDKSDKEAFNNALNLLKENKKLFMAPEGTRKKINGQRRRPRTGFIRMAQIVGCPIVPVAIWGTDRVMPPYAWFPKPTKIAVKVGKPIHLKKIKVTTEKKEQLQSQADMVMDIIYQMVDELDRKYNKSNSFSEKK